MFVMDLEVMWSPYTSGVIMEIVGKVDTDRAKHKTHISWDALLLSFSELLG